MTGRAQGTATTDFFARENKTPEGWRLPLVGNSISYRYIGLLDFAFEVWLGGDNDLTVRLGRPFTYGFGDSATSYDPRTTRKSVMGRLLGLGDLDVAEFLVKGVGELEINFSDNSRLVAGPADDGQAWRLEWPMAGDAGVAARPGGGLVWPKSERSADVSVADGPTDARTYPKPIRRGGISELPISGLVVQSAVSDMSIELMMPISGSDGFDVHFGGALEIVDTAGNLWQGRGDADDRSSLGPVLDLIGNTVTEAHADEGERLHLGFADGAQLTAASDRWEAHWPIAAGSLDEYWVPREGPSIP